jgi:hypothetical protein
MDRNGFRWTSWTWLAPPSKPLVGILGDVDGRIVPVAPPPVLNQASGLKDRRRYSPQSRSRANGHADGVIDGIAKECRFAMFAACTRL